MKRSVILLIGVILLYLVPALVLKATYGPSYSMWAGEDCWVPDHSGGWLKHGEPDSPMPTEPSVDIPIYKQYIPIFLPMLVLALFLFTPLSKKLRDPAEKSEDHDKDGESQATTSEG